MPLRKKQNKNILRLKTFKNKNIEPHRYFTGSYKKSVVLFNPVESNVVSEKYAR